MPSHDRPTPIESDNHVPYTERNDVSDQLAAERVHANNKLALSLFNQWQHSNLDDTPRRPPKLGSLGWADSLMAHKIAWTRSSIQKRIQIVDEVAAEYACPDMLSEPNLSALKMDLVRHLTTAKLGFRQLLDQMFAADGNVPPLAANAMQQRAELTFDIKCLGLINTGISTLEAKAVAKGYQLSSSCGGFPALDHFSAGPAASRPRDEAAFRKNGEMWTLSFEGKTVHISDRLGLGYIAELLRKPREPIEAALLAGTSVKVTNLRALPGIPLADETTLRNVRVALAEKKATSASLQPSDWTRKGKLAEEISQLEKYLGQVETHQGQARIVAGTAQQSRLSVTNAINRAIAAISKRHPDLGSHLKNAIKNGTAPMYAPAVVPDWQF